MLKRILDIVYPDNIYCICCGSIIDKSRPYSLCNTCLEKMHWITGRSCRICGKALQDTYTADICYDCMEEEHSFDRAFSCVSYGLYERAVIMDFKYADRAYIGRKLAEAMYDRISCEEISYDIIVPVPVHKSRKNFRGYNQAEIIAKHMSRLSGIPYMNLLVRTRATEAMKDLSIAQRRDNVRGAFEIPEYMIESAGNKDILLIDDIYTTGATFDECALTLKESGAKSVYCMAFASGANRKHEIN